MLSNVEILLTLDGLIKTCLDGQEGFQMASDGVTDDTLKNLFLDCSHQRSQFANELQMLIHHVGVTSELIPAAGPVPHRGWNNLVAAVTGGSAQDVLDACVWGEHAAANTFLDALHLGLQDPFAAVVRSQYEQVLEARSRFQTLKIASLPPADGMRAGEESPCF